MISFLEINHLRLTMHDRYSSGHESSRLRFWCWFVLFLSIAIFGNVNAQSSSQGEQIKKTVTVASFVVRAPVTEFDAQQLGEMLADQLSDALIQYGAFVVVEREQTAVGGGMDGYGGYTQPDPNQYGQMNYDQTQLAQDNSLNTTGYVLQQPMTSIRTSQGMQAQLLIKGVVTDYSATGSGSNQGVNVAGVNFGADKTTSRVGLTIRLVDTMSNQILASRRVVGEIKSKAMKLSVERKEGSFGTDTFKNSPMGAAAQIAIDEATAFIAERVRQITHSARVVKVDDVGRAIISSGSQSGILPGMRFVVMSVAEELIDPMTGEFLGYDQEEIGSIEVIRVLDRVAYTDTVAGMKVGDFVVLRAVAATVEELHSTAVARQHACSDAGC